MSLLFLYNDRYIAIMKGEYEDQFWIYDSSGIENEDKKTNTLLIFFEDKQKIIDYLYAKEIKNNKNCTFISI